MWVPGRVDWELAGETGHEGTEKVRNGIGLERNLVG